MQLKLGHLFADKLNLYGDKGNIASLVYRLKQRSIEVELDELNDENFSLVDYDFLFIGGGQDQEQVAVAEILKTKKTQLVDFIEASKPMLAICGGYQLLGETYLTSNKEVIEGLGILNVETKARDKNNKKNMQDRLIGNVVAKLNFDLTCGADLKTLVGFENHSGRTYITSLRTTALAQVTQGFGNNDTDKLEGARYKNLFASYLHGSLLPKNPHFADEIIYLALKAKYGEVEPLAKLDDNIEFAAHKKALSLK